MIIYFLGINIYTTVWETSWRLSFLGYKTEVRVPSWYMVMIICLFTHTHAQCISLPCYETNGPIFSLTLWGWTLFSFVSYLVNYNWLNSENCYRTSVVLVESESGWSLVRDCQSSIIFRFLFGWSSKQCVVDTGGTWSSILFSPHCRYLSQVSMWTLSMDWTRNVLRHISNYSNLVLGEKVCFSASLTMRSHKDGLEIPLFIRLAVLLCTLWLELKTQRL